MVQPLEKQIPAPAGKSRDCSCWLAVDSRLSRGNEQSELLAFRQTCVPLSVPPSDPIPVVIVLERPALLSAALLLTSELSRSRTRSGRPPGGASAAAEAAAEAAVRPRQGDGAGGRRCGGCGCRRHRRPAGEQGRHARCAAPQPFSCAPQPSSCCSHLRVRCEPGPEP